jgi:ABC-type multidrug transport system fused ATPase/permease subunit
MAVPVVAQRRTRNFVLHYWQLFKFARSHIGTRRLLQVVAIGFTAASAQGGILFLAATFASAMESGGAKLQEYGLGFLADSTLSALIAFSIPILLLLLYSSLAGYWAAKYARRCGRITQTQLARLLLRHMPWLDRTNLSDVIPDSGRLKRVLSRDIRQAGRSIDTMLKLIKPTIFIVVALAAMLHLEPLLSAALIAIASITVPLFYLLSRRIQENAIGYYGHQKIEAARALSNLTERLQGANIGQGSRFEEDWLEKDPAYVTFLDAYDRHKLAPEYMALRASLLRSIFVVCGLIAFGWLAIEGQRSWSILVIYVGALLYFATSLQTFLTILTKLIKYYPQTKSAAAMIERLRSASASAPVCPDLPAKINLTVRSRIDGSEPRRAMESGEVAVLLTKTPLRRLSFQGFLQPLRRASDAPSGVWDTATFVASIQPLPNDTLARAVLGRQDSEPKRAWLETFLAQALESSYGKLLPEKLETELTETLWESLPGRGKAALQLASVCAEARGVLFLDADFATKLPAQFIQDLPRTQEVEYVFIVSGDVDLPLEVAHYIVANERLIVGLGDRSWIEAQRDAIEPLVTRKRGAGDDDDEDDDDDDD